MANTDPTIPMRSLSDVYLSEGLIVTHEELCLFVSIKKQQHIQLQSQVALPHCVTPTLFRSFGVSD